MPSVSSTPPAHTRSPSIRTSASWASAVTASASCASMPLSAASLVIARYIRPLSMKGRASLSATRRPTADLPEATPPSIATIMRPSTPVQPDRPAQGGDLRLAEQAIAAGLEPAELQRPERRPAQRDDLVADLLQHPADLPVASLADHDSQLGAPRIAAAGGDSKHLDLGGRGDSVVELHARAQRLEVSRAGRAGDHRDVPLGDLVTRMGQAEGQLAVIRQEQEPRAVRVEPADREQAVAV